MDTIKDKITEDRDFTEYLMYRLLQSNNLRQEKNEIMKEFEKVLYEVANCVAYTKLNWLEDHNTNLPEWTEIFFKMECGNGCN